MKEMVGMGGGFNVFYQGGGVWILVVRREMELKEEEQGKKETK